MTNASTIPDVSVVVVSWNTRKLLLECLASLERDQLCSGLSVETIVVDNASDDESAAAVACSFPDTDVVALGENIGFAAANNLGIERSSGRSILILNPDTVVQPGALAALWRTLNAAGHVGMTAPVLLNPDGTVQSAGYRFPGMTQALLDIFPVHPRIAGSRLNGRFSPGDGFTPFRIDHPLGACMLVRREVVDRVGDFDTGYFLYSEEIDWCRRITDGGWTILCAPSARVVHLGGQSTGQVAGRTQQMLHQSRARYFRSWKSPAFLSALNMLIRFGATMRRIGLPVPTGGRTPDELLEIASFYHPARKSNG